MSDAAATLRVRRAAALVTVWAVVATAASGVLQPVFSADDATELAAGKALFVDGATPPCAVCHTLKDAGTSGAIGPVLDDLQPDAARVAAALRSGLGVMPSYDESLSAAQIQAVARYVAKASGGAK